MSTYPNFPYGSYADIANQVNARIFREHLTSLGGYLDTLKARTAGQHATREATLRRNLELQYDQRIPEVMREFRDLEIRVSILETQDGKHTFPANFLET